MVTMDGEVVVVHASNAHEDCNGDEAKQGLHVAELLVREPEYLHEDRAERPHSLVRQQIYRFTCHNKTCQLSSTTEALDHV